VHRLTRSEKLAWWSRLLTSAAADISRRSTDNTQKSSTHATAVTETGFPSDDVDRMSTFRNHESCGLDANFFNRFGG
jgi:hypothetical protein